MERIEALFHKHPYLFVVGGGLILLVLYYLFFSGSSSSGNNSAAAYYSAAAAASGANAAAQASEYQSQAQLAAYQLQAGAAATQVSAQQETTDTANNDAVSVAAINAQEAVDESTNQLNAALILTSADQSTPAQQLFDSWASGAVNYNGLFPSLYATALASPSATQTTQPTLITPPTINIPSASQPSSTTPATNTQTGAASAA